MRIVARASMIVVLVVGLIAALPGRGAAAPTTWIVVEHATGEVVAADGADIVNQPASLTKMMTLYMTFEALRAGRLTMATRLKVSPAAAAMRPSKLGLKAGTTIRVDEAISALIIRSANDAAVVLAEALGGSEPRFAQQMTRMARAKGMPRTTFRNASGWPDERQVTTARDMATLARRLILDFPEQYGQFARTQFTFRGTPIVSRNRLMATYAGMDGLKTGYTRASGYNLASSAVRDGRRLIGVVLGGSSIGQRNATMTQILDAAFARPGTRAPIEIAAAQAARALPPVVVTVPSPATAEAPDEPTAEGDAEPSHYAVQVGAFADRAAASKVAATIAARLDERDIRPLVDTGKNQRGRTIFLARLAGLSETVARDTCEALKRARQDCFVVRRSGP